VAAAGLYASKAGEEAPSERNRIARKQQQRQIFELIETLRGVQPTGLYASKSGEETPLERNRIVRKHQQRQIFELIETLREAQSAGLYADAQEGALAVGKFIEQIEGEGNPRIAGPIALLEEYCELLYGASKGEASGKTLRKHLIRLENSVRDELAPDRIEAVFVSYNASMSDSILSVHAAAKADPACDAVWLPVPYFEKSSDGSLGAMRYEGAECYPGMDCADWREYDIEARRPDAVFTFNPYDASNLVTSVHPDFYCERLRGLTDLLVYIPYFIAADELLEHFCTVAGCVYAHKVIVQSEKIRDMYIRAFKKAYGNRLGRPEGKFVALGSPKFDAVISAKREDFELPDPWRKLIGDRKVIFCSTGLSAILTGEEQYLKKLRHVFNAFGRRDDALLWWRPHPLTEATYGSMRPELADEYRRIVAEYRREGFGIYDDTPDVHRAVVWGDAYYGDWSSVAALCEASGKPSVIQYTECLSDSFNPAVLDFAFDGDEYWGFDIFADAFFQMDFKTDTAKYVSNSGVMPRYKGVSRLLTHRYGALCHENGKIIAFPMLSGSLFVWDRDYSRRTIIDIDKGHLTDPEADGFGFSKALAFDKRVYAFGDHCDSLLVFSTLDDSLSYDRRIFESLGSYCDEEYHYAFPHYVGNCDSDGNIKLIFGGNSNIFLYNLISGALSAIGTFPGIEKCYASDCFMNVLWLLASDSDSDSEKMISLELQAGNIREFTIPPAQEGVPALPGRFAGISDCGDYVLLFPRAGEAVLKFDKHGKTFSRFDELPCDDFGIDARNKYDVPKRVGGRIYAFYRQGRKIFEIDSENGTIASHQLAFDKESHLDYCRDNWESYNDESCVDHMGLGISNEVETRALLLKGGMVDTLKFLSEAREKRLFAAVCGDNEKFVGDAGKRIYEFAKARA
jgi:hypothetical protein